MTSYDKLKQIFHEAALSSDISGILHWDMSTVMPYNSRKKSDAETISVSDQGSTKPLETEGKPFHAVSSEVESPIIPLPAPFVRSEPTTFAEPETEGDKSTSIPD